MPVEPSYMCQPQRFTQAPGLLRYYRPLLGPMRATADFTGYLLPMLTATPALWEQRPAWPTVCFACVTLSNAAFHWAGRHSPGWERCCVKQELAASGPQQPRCGPGCGTAPQLTSS